MDLSLLIAMLLVTTPSDVVLLVCIGVDGYLCPISSRSWRSGKDLRKWMNRAPSSDSSADDMTALMILSMVMTAPLFVGSVASLDMKNGLLVGFLFLFWRGRRHCCVQRVPCRCNGMRQLGRVLWQRN